MRASVRANAAVRTVRASRRGDRGGVSCPFTPRHEVGLIDAAFAKWVRERVRNESYVAEVL